MECSPSVKRAGVLAACADAIPPQASSAASTRAGPRSLLRDDGI